jgi:inhibitor of KinA sporulation pathway (predicted exonuclease)
MNKIIFTEDKAVIFDLEFTSWPGSNERNWSLPEEDREVVQIGAIKVATSKGLRELDSFNVLVRPLKNPFLSEYFVNLTGITQEQVENHGAIFPNALFRFMEFIGNSPINILSNGADEDVIEENCLIHAIPLPEIFTRALDSRPYFSKILNIPEKDCCSGMLPQMFGLDNDKRPHDALEDARSISQIFRHFEIENNARITFYQ